MTWWQIALVVLGYLGCAWIATLMALVVEPEDGDGDPLSAPKIAAFMGVGWWVAAFLTGVYWICVAAVWVWDRARAMQVWGAPWRLMDRQVHWVRVRLGR